MSAQATKTPTDPSSQKIDAQLISIAIGIVLGVVMSILDSTVVVVAQPVWIQIFHANATRVSWTQTGYTLALAAVIPLSSWSVHRFGGKKVYLFSLIFFTLGSLLCGFSHNLGQLIIFRVVQGFGGGMLLPVGMTILREAAGPLRIARLLSIIGIPMLIGPIVGPVVGGWLVEVDWHYIFLINIPLGIVAFCYCFWVLPASNEKKYHKLDIISLLLLSPGLSIFLFGLTRLESKKINLLLFFTTICISLLAITLFVINALRRKSPLIELRLFQQKEVSLSLATYIFYFFALFGIMMILPQYFQHLRGWSSLRSGLLNIPMGIGAMITMPLSGRFTDKYGAKSIVIVGLILSLCATSGFFLFNTATTVTYIELTCFILGLAQGMVVMPISATALSRLSPLQIPSGTTIISISQQVGASVGAATITTILVASSPNFFRGIQHGFIFSLVTTTIALILALYIPSRKLSLSQEASIVQIH